MTPEENYKKADEITKEYSEYETYVFLLIAVYLNRFDGDIKEWQSKTLKQREKFLIEANKELTKLSINTLRTTKKHIRDISDVEATTIVKDLQKAGFYGKIVTVNTNNIVKSNFNYVNKYINNNVKLDLIKNNQKDGKLKKLYTNIVKDVSNSFIAGNLDFNEALSKVINQYINNGLMSGYVDKAGRRWQIDTYMDSVLRNTYKQVFNDVRTKGMFDNGVYTVFMNTVPNCAPRCSMCQGRVLDMREPSKADSGYPSIYNFDYGLAGGTLGCNCRHYVMPYIAEKGLNNPALSYTDKDLANYKNTQKQRYYERALRKNDRFLSVAKELNDNKNIQKYTQRNAVLNKKIKKVVANNKNTRRRFEREVDRTKK